MGDALTLDLITVEAGAIYVMDRGYIVSGLLTPRFWGVDGSGATATAFVFLA
jgi:hypothetical protein